MDNNSKFIIDYNDEGKRLDAYLSEMLVDISRSKIQSAIKKGEILVNSKTAKPSYQLRENDIVESGNIGMEKIFLILMENSVEEFYIGLIEIPRGF